MPRVSSDSAWIMPVPGKDFIKKCFDIELRRWFLGIMSVCSYKKGAEIAFRAEINESKFGAFSLFFVLST